MNVKCTNAKKTCELLAATVYNVGQKSMQASNRTLFDLGYRLRRHSEFHLKGQGRSRHHGLRGQGDGKLYSAGQPVVETGIYEVIHDREHRTTHEVVMLSGDAFPPCDTCAERVRFRLVRTAPYIFQDEDFEESE
ncbi:MAG TPA: hypothetical protein VN669_03945 [Candidatus Acidoferrales bacterium]|jgi:hypothetical protein|nr:hypothetical protein [Candidatus Acidoferrales bacterium]